MKTMKKLMGAVLVGAMTIAMSITTFAATGVSADEQALLDKAAAKAKEMGVDTNASAQYKQYYAQAEQFLASNELTAAQAKELIAAVDSAADTVKKEMDAKGATKLGDLKADADLIKNLESKVVSQIKTAAANVGITVSVDASGNYTATAGDAKVADSSNPIKQTGFDMTATIVVVAAFAGAIAVCLVVASKKRFIEEN